MLREEPSELEIIKQAKPSKKAHGAYTKVRFA